MDIDNYNKIKEHLHLICFAAGSPVFMLIASHVIACRFKYVMNTLSIVKLTWSFISFLGREELGIYHTIYRLVISVILIGICIFEMSNRQFFLDKPFMIGVDFFFTFYRLVRYYFQWVKYYLRVDGILEDAYLLQTAITAVAVWKTYDKSVKDRMLPFAVAYIASIAYYTVFFIIQFYIIQKGQKLSPDSEDDKKEEEKKTDADENDGNKKSNDADDKNKIGKNNKASKNSHVKTD